MLSDLPIWLLISIFLIAFVVIGYISNKLWQKITEILYPFKKGKRYWCKVIAVSDGDTISCKRINMRRSTTKIRLAYIDAPESSQEFGAETRKMVMSLVYRKLVRIHIIDTDRYGRHVAEVHRRGKHINEELIKRGGAWVYPDYIKDKKYIQKLNKLQTEAKKDKKGLWRNAKAVRPSDYRKSS